MDWKTVIGDAAWILALSVMASGSFSASKRIPPDARVPMHFAADGHVTRRASKAMALLFNLALALIAAIFLRLMAHRTAQVNGAWIATLLSVALAPVLAITHLSLLDRAMKVLDQEGVLRR